jgi:hypothetical protein
MELHSTQRPYSAGRDGLFGLIKSTPPEMKYENSLIMAEGDMLMLRQVTLVLHGVQLKKRSVGGEEKKYWPAVARAGGKRISLSEIIIGPNRNDEDSRDQLKEFLAAHGYKGRGRRVPRDQRLCNRALERFAVVMVNTATAWCFFLGDRHFTNRQGTVPAACLS